MTFFMSKRLLFVLKPDFGRLADLVVGIVGFVFKSCLEIDKVKYSPAGKWTTATSRLPLVPSGTKA
jgi:hypothetical protein